MNEKSISEAGVKTIIDAPRLIERLNEYLDRQQESDKRTPLADWLDNSDVMRALNISQRTLQTLRTNGTLPYSQIGGKLYYKHADIEALLDRNYVAHKEKGGKK